MPSGRLRPLTLCISSGQGATFALYGRDKDDDRADIYAKRSTTRATALPAPARTLPVWFVGNRVSLASSTPQLA
jgi:hypothetical protein